MFYDFSFTVPANTPASAPASLEMKLTRGIVHNVKLLFPPGPHGMVKVGILHGLHQFLPTNPDGYFASDDENINIDEHYELTEAPFILKAVGYSPGTTYNHTISIRIGILSPEIIEPYAGVSGMLRKFLKLVGVG
ncbi:MAG: hypothetical protein HYX96_06150 [Chloroflexi bacterium]|nr:hypothetical protein [Chloroflexota bacterium]